jgi:hypothetical protein
LYQTATALYISPTGGLTLMKATQVFFGTPASLSSLNLQPYRFLVWVVRPNGLHLWIGEVMLLICEFLPPIL